MFLQKCQTSPYRKLHAAFSLMVMLSFCYTGLYELAVTMETKLFLNEHVNRTLIVALLRFSELLLTKNIQQIGNLGNK